MSKPTKRYVTVLENTVADLKSKNFDLDREVFEAQQFERIASEKLSEWVTKHDELLIRFKTLAARFKKLHPYAKI